MLDPLPEVALQGDSAVRQAHRGDCSGGGLLLARALEVGGTGQSALIVRLPLRLELVIFKVSNVKLP